MGRAPAFSWTSPGALSQVEYGNLSHRVDLQLKKLDALNRMELKALVRRIAMLRDFEAAQQVVLAPLVIGGSDFLAPCSGTTASSVVISSALGTAAGTLTVVA